MGNNGASSIKVRSTPPKDQASTSSLQESKKDSSPTSSETSSISGEIVGPQETTQDNSSTTLENVVPSQTSSSSVEMSVTETKENVNPHTIEDASSTNATGKRKKPKSKLIIYFYSLAL